MDKIKRMDKPIVTLDLSDFKLNNHEQSVLNPGDLGKVVAYLVNKHNKLVDYLENKLV